MVIKGKGTKEDLILLDELIAEEVPLELRPESFFDLEAHPCEHRALIDEARSVVDIIAGIEKYTREWLAKKIDLEKEGDLEEITKTVVTGRYSVLKEPYAIFDPEYVMASSEEVHTIYLAKDVQVLGAKIHLDKGDIYIGEGTKVESGAGIKGPAIIGKRNEIRQNAYLRGNVIIGNQKKFGDNALRLELKNVLMLDEVNFPHPSYLGDSICGYNTHMGNEATAANLGIFQGIRDRDKRVNLKVKINDKWYDLGRSKMGVVLGDKTQIGCETFVDPGTLLGPRCISYGLAYIKSGYYPPGTIFKTRPEKFIEVQIGKFDQKRL